MNVRLGRNVDSAIWFRSHEKLKALWSNDLTSSWPPTIKSEAASTKNNFNTNSMSRQRLQ